MADRIHRRTALKLAGAAVGGATGVLGQGTVAAHGDRGAAAAADSSRDGPLEVTVFVSEELYQLGREKRSDGYHAGKVLTAYIEGAFEQTDEWDVDVTLAEARPDPPRDDLTSGPGKSFGGECNCNSPKRYRQDCDDPCCWPGLFRWFRDWYWDGWNPRKREPIPETCGDPHARSTDANLLLTRGTGGGISSGNPGRVAVATVGDDLMDADPEYRKFGYREQKFRAIRAALHEVGHCLMDGSAISDRDDDGDPWGSEHDMSSIKYDPENDDYGITPMGVHGDQNNELTNDHDKSRSIDTPALSFLPWIGEADDKPDGFAYFYSVATLQHFYYKEPHDLNRQCGAARKTTDRTGTLSEGDDGATYSYSTRTEAACELTVTLDGPTGADFDLYLTLDGRTPSRNDYDRRSRTLAGGESITLTEGTNPELELGILVSRYEDTGEYTLTVRELGR